MRGDLRSGSNGPDAPRTVKSLDGVGWTAMHLLCKVHCRMQCKTATFAMQRERKRVREREGVATLPISPLLAWAGRRC